MTAFALSRLISGEEQDQYIEVPFDMPPDVERLHVRYEVRPCGEGRCVVDLGVKDPHRVRGWSGGARTEFEMGAESATPGYLPGPLEEGKWAVLLGAYRIPQDGCEVRIEVTLRQETLRWLKGDLHMHSVHSDGAFTLTENARIMEELGCDFMAMTDHNTVSQNYAYPRETHVVLIPGMELTTNYGHSNFLGAVDPVRDFRAVSMEQVHSRIREAREAGARIVLNHPHCPNCGWLWDFAVDYDWVEVWNGPWREANQTTLDWWQEQLCSGKRLVAVGGSDVHRPDLHVKHSMPTTWVYSRSRTAKGILEAIGQGHVFLSYAPDGPTLELTCGSAMMGDLVRSGTTGASDTVELAAARLLGGDKVRVISERGVERETSVQADGECRLLLEAGGRKFLRAEVWRHFPQADRTLLAAMSNPIYFTTG